MAEKHRILVREALADSEFVAGASDGGQLARKLIGACREYEGDVTLDFSGIVSISNSASCAFWTIVLNELSNHVLGRLVFVHCDKPIMRSLEYGLEYCVGHASGEQHPEPSPM